jgi:hypothetical protein
MKCFDCGGESCGMIQFADGYRCPDCIVRGWEDMKRGRYGDHRPSSCSCEWARALLSSTRYIRTDKDPSCTVHKGG